MKRLLSLAAATCVLAATVAPAHAAVTLVTSTNTGNVYRFNVDNAGNWIADGTFVSGLTNPSPIAFDGTYVYVGEQDDGGRLLRYTLGGTLDAVIATEGTEFTGRPDALAVAPDGSLVMSVAFGSNSDRVYRISDPTGAASISTILGTGLDNPRGLAVDGSGNIYLADRNNNRILKIDSTGTILETSGTVTAPQAVHLDGSTLYFANNFNDPIFLTNDLTVDGEAAGSGFTVLAEPTAGGSYLDFVVLNGTVFVSHYDSGTIRLINGDTVTSGLGNPSHIAVIPEPASLLLIGAGGLLMLRRRRSTN